MSTNRPQPDVAEQPRFLVFGQPCLGEEEIAEVTACLRSGWIGTGPRVERFEREFAAFKGVGRAAAVASCTAALHLAVRVAGLEPGDEVVTTPLTFCSTVNAIVHAGARPVLADIDPVTMNLDPRQVEAAVGPRTRAILPVHFAGRPCEMAELETIARRRGLKIIEDCAHAIEAEYHGRTVGTMGDFGCFSFYATKNVTTGDGGIVLARREQDLESVRVLASHGIGSSAWQRFRSSGFAHYTALSVGFKYTMTDLQAAVGLPQLRRIAENWERRHAIWCRYLDAFASLPVVLPSPPAPKTRHALHLFTMLVNPAVAGRTRDEFVREMTAAGVGVGVHYVALPEHPAYREQFGWRPEEWPEAMRVGRHTVSLPLGPGLTTDDVERVVRAVHRALGAA